MATTREMTAVEGAIRVPSTAYGEIELAVRTYLAGLDDDAATVRGCRADLAVTAELDALPELLCSAIG